MVANGLRLLRRGTEYDPEASPAIVFSATAFALIGLRSLYFLLAGVRVRFHHLDTGLAVILGFVGVLTATIAASLPRRSRR